MMHRCVFFSTNTYPSTLLVHLRGSETSFESNGGNLFSLIFQFGPVSRYRYRFATRSPSQTLTAAPADSAVIKRNDISGAAAAAAGGDPDENVPDWLRNEFEDAEADGGSGGRIIASARSSQQQGAGGRSGGSGYVQCLSDAMTTPDVTISSYHSFANPQQCHVIR